MVRTALLHGENVLGPELPHRGRSSGGEREGVPVAGLALHLAAMLRHEVEVGDPDALRHNQGGALEHRTAYLLQSGPLLRPRHSVLGCLPLQTHPPEDREGMGTRPRLAT